MDLCSLEMTLFCSRLYLPLLQFIRWWCQITVPDIFILFGGGVKRTNHCKCTQKKFSDRNDDWLWSLMPHQCLRRSLDIQADCVIFVSVQRVFLGVINLVCGRIWSLACTVLLTTIRNGPLFFTCLYILTKKLEMARNFSLVGLTLRAWQTH